MKTLKILVLFIVVLSGCSIKYLSHTEEELIDRKIIVSWKELDGKIITQDEDTYMLNLRVRDFIEAKDSVKLTEVYKTGEDINWAQVLLGGGGVYYGFGYMYSYWHNNEISRGCLAFGVVISGLVTVADGLVKGYPFTKITPDRIKIDTVCEDSIPLVKAEVKVSVEQSNFDNMYLSDENGNIELSFDEIVPKPTESDSEIELIIQYGEMVDTVEVRLR